MNEIEKNSGLPDNMMAMLTLSDIYGEPFVNIAHREADNDDTAAFSLITGEILAGALSSSVEEEETSQWVLLNKDHLLTAWQNEELKIITNDGRDD